MASEHGGSIVLISDNPMTLGIQFLMSHTQEAFKGEVVPYGIIASPGKSTDLEYPFSKLEQEPLLSFLRQKKPLVIGVSTIERSRGRSLPFLSIAQSVLPNSLFIAGGVDASSHPASYFNSVDLVARGDGEQSLEGLLKSILNGKKKEEIVSSPPQGFISPAMESGKAGISPARMPLPYYGENLLFLRNGMLEPFELSPNPFHVQFLERSAAFDMFTQRGCTHACTFCAQDLIEVYGKGGKRNTFGRPLAEIVEYLQKLKGKYPKKGFVYFWDLDFLRRPKRELMQFAELYKENVGLPYFIFVTEKTVNAAGQGVLEALVGSGLSTINMGIQSGSERVLHEVYERHNTPEEALKAIHTIHAATRNKPVEALYDIITYNPRERPEEIEESIRLVCGIPPAECPQTVRLSTHVLSYNTGQILLTRDSRESSHYDYQDFSTNPGIYAATQSPWRSFLLGNLMRGPITSHTIGSVQRSQVPALLDPAFCRFMDAHPDHITLYRAFIPRDNEIFAGK